MRSDAILRRCAFILLSGASFAAFAQVPAKADSGDTAWMLTATMLVLLMTIPGLALFYGGMVRAKNLLSVLMQCFAITALISVLWMLYGIQRGLQHGRHAGRRNQPALVRRRPRPRDVRRHDACKPVRPRSGKRVRDVPADLRDHHAGPDRGRGGRAHEILCPAGFHRCLVQRGLSADGAHGVGRPGFIPRRSGRARFRRRHGRAYQCRHRRSGRLPGAGTAARLSACADAATQPRLHADRRQHAVAGLVRFQRGLGGSRERQRRHGDAGDPGRHRCRGAWPGWRPNGSSIAAPACSA